LADVIGEVIEMPTAPPQLPPTRPVALIAIDVDGTLLTSDHKVAPGAPEAIREAHALGMMPVLMTGRSTLAIRAYFETLDLSPYCIGAGGAFIARIDGEVISIAPIRLQYAAEIARRVRARGMGLCFHGLDRFICEVDDETFASLLDIVGGTAERAEDVLRAVDADPVKITIFGDRDQLEELKRELAALGLPVTATFSGPNFLEVTQTGVSKGRALAHLAEVLEVPLDQVAAIGDQENDLSAFEVAGFSAAMGNAPQAVKAAADYVAPSNDEGGLAVVLHALVRRREAHESQD
jgi:Cof subfamily protein (haloacid dehalogenase superfamily)